MSTCLGVLSLNLIRILLPCRKNELEEKELKNIFIMAKNFKKN